MLIKKIVFLFLFFSRASENVIGMTEQIKKTNMLEKKTGKPFKKAQRPCCIAFHYPFLYFGGSDASLNRYDINTKICTKLLGNLATPYKLSINNDGDICFYDKPDEKIYVYDGKIHVRLQENDKKIRTQCNLLQTYPCNFEPINGATCNPHNKKHFFACTKKNLWDITFNDGKTYKQELVWPEYDDVNDKHISIYDNQLTCSPDGKTLAISYSVKTKLMGWYPSINVYGAHEYTPHIKVLDISLQGACWVCLQHPFKAPISTTAFSPDNGHFVACTHDGLMVIWKSEKWITYDSALWQKKAIVDIKKLVPTNLKNYCACVTSCTWISASELALLINVTPGSPDQYLVPPKEKYLLIYNINTPDDNYIILHKTIF